MFSKAKFNESALRLNDCVLGFVVASASMVWFSGFQEKRGISKVFRIKSILKSSQFITVQKSYSVDYFPLLRIPSLTHTIWSKIAGRKAI
jgi:hypothetical protein